MEITNIILCTLNPPFLPSTCYTDQSHHSTSLAYYIHANLVMREVYTRLLPLLLTTTYIPFSLSLRTTSDTSNILMGRAIFLLDAMVFRSPGRREVLATYIEERGPHIISYLGTSCVHTNTFKLSSYQEWSNAPLHVASLNWTLLHVATLINEASYLCTKIWRGHTNSLNGARAMVSFLVDNLNLLVWPHEVEPWLHSR